MEKRPTLGQLEENSGEFGGLKFAVTRVLILDMMVMVVFGQSRDIVGPPIYLYTEV